MRLPKGKGGGVKEDREWIIWRNKERDYECERESVCVCACIREKGRDGE